MKERPAGRSCARCENSAWPDHAALSHIDVSNALLISGMFMPKLAFAACLPAPFAACLTATFWATSVARSHDPFSWERATEKNKNT
jgi:hypothetical protein